jgi:hypothetical protein
MRRDEFCPSSQLLSHFRYDKSMTFGQYGRAYAEELAQGSIDAAVASVVMSLASDALPVFYCVDPYIPGYSRPEDMLVVPFEKRTYLSSLRDEGCHRVVLVEEIAQRFRSHGFSVEIFEVDQLCQDGAHLRRHDR